MKVPMLGALLLAPVAAFAADSENFKVEGKVAELQGVTAADSAFRATLEKAPALCGNSWTYTSIGEKDDNFKGIVELLLLAKSSKAPVMLVSRKDGQGYCRLVSVTVR